MQGDKHAITTSVVGTRIVVVTFEVDADLSEPRRVLADDVHQEVTSIWHRIVGDVWVQVDGDRFTYEEDPPRVTS